MSNIKFNLLILTFLSVVSSNLAADKFITQPQLWEKFNKMGGTYQPVFVTVNDGRAAIILEQDYVSLSFVLAAIPSVACSPGEGEKYFGTVEEVAILNNKGSQGYILIGGKETCGEIYNSSREYSDILIKAHLKPHTVE
jgi:hypothetical protein